MDATIFPLARPQCQWKIVAVVVGGVWFRLGRPVIYEPVAGPPTNFSNWRAYIYFDINVYWDD